MQVKEHVPTSFIVFTSGLAFESSNEFRGVPSRQIIFLSLRVGWLRQQLPHQPLSQGLTRVPSTHGGSGNSLIIKARTIQFWYGILEKDLR
jgi:hypothetical protein